MRHIEQSWKFLPIGGVEGLTSDSPMPNRIQPAGRSIHFQTALVLSATMYSSHLHREPPTGGNDAGRFRV